MATSENLGYNIQDVEGTKAMVRKVIKHNQYRRIKLEDTICSQIRSLSSSAIS